MLDDLLLAAPPDVLITRCAWCSRYEVEDAWLHHQRVTRFLRDDGSEVTHGICPACIADLRARGLSV